MHFLSIVLPSIATYIGLSGIFKHQDISIGVIKQMMGNRMKYSVIKQ